MCIKKVAVLFFFLLFLVNFCMAEDGLQLQEKKDKISYSVGYQVGSDFKRQGVVLNSEAMLRGVSDAMSTGVEPLITKQEMKAILVALQKQIEADAQKTEEEKIADNLLEGKTFLAENAKKEGVTVLASGLQYVVLKKGTGAMPKQDSMVEVLYRTALLDGTEIGNSSKEGKPATFKVSSAIPGLKEALPMMKEGAKWRLFLPADLAFGKKKNTPMAGQTIIFEIELLSIRGAD